jgi:hypothetical protein
MYREIICKCAIRKKLKMSLLVYSISRRQITQIYLNKGFCHACAHPPFKLINMQNSVLRDLPPPSPPNPTHSIFAVPINDYNDIKRKPHEKYQFGRKIRESVPLLS